MQSTKSYAYKLTTESHSVYIWNLRENSRQLNT